MCLIVSSAGNCHGVACYLGIFGRISEPYIQASFNIDKLARTLDLAAKQSSRSQSRARRLKNSPEESPIDKAAVRRMTMFEPRLHAADVRWEISSYIGMIWPCCVQKDCARQSNEWKLLLCVHEERNRAGVVSLLSKPGLNQFEESRIENWESASNYL